MLKHLVIRERPCDSIRVMNNSLSRYIKECQAKIRVLAAKNPEHGAALTDPKNYRTYRVRRSVDEGFRATFVEVHFSWPEHLVTSASGRGTCVGMGDNDSEARAIIAGRCSALDS